VLHTWTFELRDIVAYVAIESPEKRCGKTTLLSVLAAMASKPLIASNLTVGALFRAIDTCRPTLFIDEADTFLAGNSIMRGIINSGNTRRTAYVLRLSAAKNNPEPTASSPSPDNTQTGLKRYSCWCPKVIAMIGEVPDTIADRSIVVKMSRKLVTETCAPLAELNPTEIKAKCARFALDFGPEIARARKIHGEALNDRAADTFDPLYVIARLAGHDWEQKLHSAAVILASTDDTEKSGSGLILDILDIFFDRASEKIFTRDLVTRLRDGNMKSQALKYSSLNEHQISRILRPYGIKPVCVRIGEEVRNGYISRDFYEALNRYVSRADKEARVEAIQQRVQLQIEAHAEAKKRKALMDKVLAKSPRTIREAKAMFQEELDKEEENNLDTSPSPAC